MQFCLGKSILEPLKFEAKAGVSNSGCAYVCHGNDKKKVGKGGEKRAGEDDSGVRKWSEEEER